MSSLTHVGFQRRPVSSLIYGTAKPRPASRIYRPLPAGSIRLLKVLPAANDADPIALWLESIQLEDAGLYCVLSYVWGDAAADETHVVLLNGTSLRVTTSLFNALRRFRDASEARTFWIDALCVDWTDLADRSQHISLMTMLQIYAKAEAVVMWSGEGSDANTGMLFKTAKARYEVARHKKLLERPLEKFPVHLCGEGLEFVRALVGVRDRVLGLGCRPRGDLEKILEADGVGEATSEA
ncbi:hypothetical protein A9Z42_0048310 [Trichoderma parareesei]|uniref:Heterokaryon incompatibility domain-containing protein n=1 Tax=Trichoderma parareesei TaxID=858221 RepID=A0A2H2ZAL0_TRIPA|nr:hypothetical protein A9Z42_0048310 [Trichoderma parareesei]